MKSFYGALLKAQKDMGSVTKDAKNPFFKSNYATLNAVRESVMPVLNANGIVLTQPTVIVEGKLYVETRLTHAESAEYITGVTEVIVKNLGDAQQAGSGISYARRYGLMSLLCLAAEDDDGQAAVGKATPKTGTTFTTGAVSNPESIVSGTIGVPSKKISFSKKAVTQTIDTGDDI